MLLPLLLTLMLPTVPQLLLLMSPFLMLLLMLLSLAMMPLPLMMLPEQADREVVAEASDARDKMLNGCSTRTPTTYAPEPFACAISSLANRSFKNTTTNTFLNLHLGIMKERLEPLTM